MRMQLITALLCSSMTLAACSRPPVETVKVPPSPPIEGFEAVTPQLVNVGDAGSAAMRYHDSGEYDRDVAIIAGKARSWLETHAATAKPAIVFDIDDTALTNWAILKRDDFGRPIAGPCDLALDAPCGWAAWDQIGRDPPIMPTLDLYRAAINRNVAVFFITGRPENQRAATERNLNAAGYGRYEHLYMVPDGAHFASAVLPSALSRPVSSRLYRFKSMLNDLSSKHFDRNLVRRWSL